MAVQLSAAALWPHVKPFYRLWLIVACFWWVYLAWGYWSYKLPEFDPEPVDPGPYSHIAVSIDPLPLDDYSLQQEAYREKWAAYYRRRVLREKLIWFSLPISIPLVLWGGTAALLFVYRWTVKTSTKQ